MDIANRKIIEISPRTLILFFLVINPLIEIIYAMFSVGYSGVLNANRILRFAALFIMLIDIKNIKAFKRLFGIAVVFVLSYIGVIIVDNQISIGTDISYLIKIYMGFVVYYYFYEKLSVGQLNENLVNSCLIYASIIVSTVILLGYIGVGSLSYGDGGRYGHVGWFSIVCTPSSYLLMVLPLAMKWKRKTKWVAIILSCIALPSLGTKTGVIGLIMLLTVVWCYYLKRKVKRTTAIFLIGGSIIGIIVAFILIYIYIPYLANLFMSNSFYHGSIYSFIVSNRDTQVSLAQRYVESLSGFDKLITNLSGAGYSRIENVLNSTYGGYYAIEMDFHSIFFCCGAVISIMVLYRIVYGIKTGFINWRHSKTQDDFYLLLSLSIATVHAYLGGHTLTDSMCIFPIYIIMAIISSRRVKSVNKSNRSLVIIGV